MGLPQQRFVGILQKIFFTHVKIAAGFEQGNGCKYRKFLLTRITLWQMHITFLTLVNTVTDALTLVHSRNTDFHYIIIKF